MALRPLTPSRSPRGTDSRTPEALLERTSALAAERQRLRADGASSAALERNRLEIVRAQQQLAHALLEQHLAAL